MSANRIAWIDALKGLGMILVILGHMSIPEMARQFIFSFHMPLFFIVSGYLFKNNFSLVWSLRKFDTLFVPYIVYSALTLGVWIFVGKIDFQTGARMLAKGNGLGLTWFFSCMLVTELLGGVLLKYGSKLPRYGLVIMAVSLAAWGWFMPRLGIPEYFKCNGVPMAVAFWLTGWLLRDHAFRVCELLIAAGFASFFWVQRVDMNTACYGNGFLFFGSALGFVTLLLWVFEKYQIAWKPLTFVGERSLEFMCLHGLIPLLCTELLSRAGILVPKPIARVAYLFIVIVLAYLIHAYMPLLSGRMLVFRRFIGERR